jgi:cytochrome c553
MKRIIITTSFVAIAAWFAAPADVSAGEALGNVDKGRVIYQFGKGDDIPACAGCHAEDGLGSDEVGSPRLAYQIAPYVRKQLHDFGKDLRTDDTMYQMNDIAKAMSEEDINDVAAYVHTLKTPYIGSNLDQLRRDGADVGDPHKGKMIPEYGSPDHGVPACASCHGFHGRSAGNMYPAIGGQNYVYLQHELTSFRNGANTSAEDIASGNKADNARTNDYMGQMRAVAKNLTDEDIKNLAAFLTLAKPTTPGNPRAPSH